MALLLCVGCGGSNGSDDSDGCDSIYQVGDYYNRDFNKGIVFDVTNGGRNGKILSLDETVCNWSDAEQWCRNHGDGWRLPTCDELKAIYRNQQNVNEGLRKYNREELANSYYWSSTEYEYNSDCAWIVYMDDGDTYLSFSKYNSYYVRAVYEF